MNETVPPIPSSKSVPKTSGLAIWSLVLGILSLTCFSILTAIPGVICGHVSLSNIKKSAGKLEGRGLAIGGLITGYIGLALALVVVPLMFAIAIPNFTKARATAEKNACLNNLRMIESAKQSWALEHKKENTDRPTMQDLLPYLPGGTPHCLAGGTYTINAVGEASTCSIPDHKLVREE